MGISYNISERCSGCKEKTSDDVNIFGSSHSLYVVPSGNEIPRSKFESIAWCNKCEYFQICYNPIDIEIIKQKKKNLYDEYLSKTTGIYYQIIGKYIRRRIIDVKSITNQMSDCDNLFEFASNRLNYSAPKCSSCGSDKLKIIHTSGFPDDVVVGKLSTNRFHKCGFELIYEVSQGHYSSRLLNGQKPKKYDCNDNILNE
jgi:hypothetical protein